MSEDDFTLTRTVLGYRLIGLSVAYIAQTERISTRVVKGILLEHGYVSWRGRRRFWKGHYAITPEKHKALSLPAYIPMRVDGVTTRMTNQVAWMALTRDTPVLRWPDGSRKLYGGDAPFHRDQGFTTPPPDDINT